MLFLLCIPTLVQAGEITDSSGKTVSVASPPSRILSLGGSVTETVYALGLGEAVVGVDASSVYPEEATKRSQVGYHRQLGAEGVLSLNPDLVLATEDTGPPAVLDQLRAAGVPLAMLPAEPSVEGAQKRITMLAQLLDVEDQGKQLIATLDAQLADVDRPTERPKVLFIYARGGGVLNVAGKETAADEIMRLAGADNAVDGYTGYKSLTPEAAVAAAPDYVLVTTRGLGSLGGRDGLKKVQGLSLTPAVKNDDIIVMDDLFLLGFGPRTGQAAQALAEALRGDTK